MYKFLFTYKRLFQMKLQITINRSPNSEIAIMKMGVASHTVVIKKICREAKQITACKNRN